MLKNLKSLFVTTEEHKPEQQEQPQQAKGKPEDAAKGEAIRQAKEIDNAILDRLLQAIEDNNQSGFDYLEYRRSLKSLAALPMDEMVKFQSAYATASTMGVTLEKLLASIDFYRKVLMNERDNFTKASKEQYAINVEGKLKEKDNINNVINEKSLKIQKLTEEIRKHQADLEEMTKVIEAGDRKIKETTGNFETALHYLLSQMDQDTEKLKTYIK
jgi:hypothetical protein